ncbi:MULTISPECIES: hypothetical protein [Methylobacterium]|uniref:hypothetical protein n=1 Tax=Methylobacterium TaxID=407 RepID=UPI00272EC2F7|nr:hypothetical protein [Methylobacterium sp.]
MTCALATAAVAVTLASAPMCPRADRPAVPGEVMAALRGEAVPPAPAPSEIRAAIEAISPPARSRRR